jgi:membrane dipeptidase
MRMPTVPVTRRQFVCALAAGAISAALPHARAADAPQPKWRNYSKLTVIDALGGPGNANKPDKPLDAADLADVRMSGVTAVNLTVSGVGSYARDYEKTIAGIAQCDREIALHPDVLMKFNDARDFAVAKKSGRLAIIYGFQDATPLAENLDRLDTFRGLGVRIIQLT